MFMRQTDASNNASNNIFYSLRSINGEVLRKFCTSAAVI
ncbi:portal protein [Salmonella phage 41]|nr:portal protein [Salmonella phage 41]